MCISRDMLPLSRGSLIITQTSCSWPNYVDQPLSSAYLLIFFIKWLFQDIGLRNDHGSGADRNAWLSILVTASSKLVRKCVQTQAKHIRKHVLNHWNPSWYYLVKTANGSLYWGNHFERQQCGHHQYIILRALQNLNSPRVCSIWGAMYSE